MIKNYKEMPLGMYAEYHKILLKYKPDEGDIKDDDAIDLQVEIISLLTGKTNDEVFTLPLDRYRQCVKDIQFLQDKCEPGKMQKEYKIGKMTFIPCSDINKWTADQYISFQAFLKAGDTVGMMSCILIPKKKNFADGYDLEQIREILNKNLSLYDAMSISAFFLQQYKHSISNMITCSVRETIMMVPTWKGKMNLIRRAMNARAFLKNGDGSETLRQSVN